MFYRVVHRGPNREVVTVSIEDYFRNALNDSDLAVLEMQQHNNYIVIGYIVSDTDNTKIRILKEKKVFVFKKNILVNMLKQGISWNVIENFSLLSIYKRVNIV